MNLAAIFLLALSVSQALPPQSCAVYVSWKGSGEQVANPLTTLSNADSIVSTAAWGGSIGPSNHLSQYAIDVPVETAGLTLNLQADAAGDWPAVNVSTEMPSLPGNTKVCAIEAIINPLGKTPGRSGAVGFHLTAVTP